MPFLDFMTQFQVQLRVFHSLAEYKTLFEQILADLKKYLDESHKQLQAYLQNMLKQAPEIVHTKGDTFANKNIHGKIGMRWVTLK